MIEKDHFLRKLWSLTKKKKITEPAKELMKILNHVDGWWQFLKNQPLASLLHESMLSEYGEKYIMLDGSTY